MHQYRVCVADDAVEEAELLVEGLKLHHFDAFAVHSGQALFETLEQETFDLLLLDVNLPDTDGYAICERLKSNPETAALPVIFVTARGGAEDVDRGYSLGAVDYIGKPYNLPIVMVRVDAAMRTKHVADHVRVYPEPVADPAYTDEITGLRNSRYLIERFQEEVDKSNRYRYPVSCLVFDIDDFTTSHSETGESDYDVLLVDIAIAMRYASRNYDILARYDDAVFAAVLPHALLDDALAYAKKIQEEVRSRVSEDLQQPDSGRLRFGIVVSEHSRGQNADGLLAEAMRRMLCAEPQNGLTYSARFFESTEQAS